MKISIMPSLPSPVLAIASSLDRYEFMEGVTCDKELGGWLVEHGLAFCASISMASTSSDSLFSFWTPSSLNSAQAGQPSGGQ